MNKSINNLLKALPITNKLATLWVFCCLVLLIFTPTDFDFLIKVLAPLVITALFLYLYRYTPAKFKPYLPYLLFFSISISSLLGYTKELTGSHALSTNSYLYGLSFYSASLAYYLKNEKKTIDVIDSFKFTNPLLLFTGPIALFIKKLGQQKIKKRLNYFLPFILIGLFYYLVIAAPLTSFFFLIEKVDLISVYFFAFIFEVFVYANFCGLSLIIYGIFGLLGFRVPLNFKQPYSSSNILDFWKGNHRSLQIVLKKLFYTPLRRHFSHFIALSSVFIASALWHGITINFIIWGFFHALIYWLSLLLVRNKIKLIPVFLLIFGVITGRLIFADSDTDRLMQKLMFSYDGFDMFSLLYNVPNTSIASLMIGSSILSIEFFFQKNKTVKKRNYKYLRSPLALAILFVIGVILIKSTGGDYAVYGQR